MRRDVIASPRPAAAAHQGTPRPREPYVTAISHMIARIHAPAPMVHCNISSLRPGRLDSYVKVSQLLLIPAFVRSAYVQRRHFTYTECLRCTA